MIASLGRVEAVERHVHAPHAADLPVESPAGQPIGLEAAVPDRRRRSGWPGPRGPSREPEPPRGRAPVPPGGAGRDSGAGAVRDRGRQRSATLPGRSGQRDITAADGTHERPVSARARWASGRSPDVPGNERRRELNAASRRRGSTAMTYRKCSMAASGSCRRRRTRAASQRRSTLCGSRRRAVSRATLAGAVPPRRSARRQLEPRPRVGGPEPERCRDGGGPATRGLRRTSRPAPAPAGGGARVVRIPGERAPQVADSVEASRGEVALRSRAPRSPSRCPPRPPEQHRGERRATPARPAGPAGAMREAGAESPAPHRSCPVSAGPSPGSAQARRRPSPLV